MFTKKGRSFSHTQDVGKKPALADWTLEYKWPFSNLHLISTDTAYSNLFANSFEEYN